MMDDGGKMTKNGRPETKNWLYTSFEHISMLGEKMRIELCY